MLSSVPSILAGVLSLASLTRLAMRLRTLLTAPLIIVSLIACGGDDPAGPSSYETIAGSYAGSMAGVSQGVAADLDFALTIAQTSGNLSGTWVITGTLTDGVDVVPVQGTGTLAGAIASGNNPSVNLTIRNPACPAYSAGFSGAYDSANRRLTITGPVEFFQAGTCSVALRYTATIILNR